LLKVGGIFKEFVENSWFEELGGATGLARMGFGAASLKELLFTDF
jgi:hypothetical protein